MSDVSHNVQYELHEISDYLENMKKEEVLNICKKFIDIMKQKKSDYDLQVPASEIFFIDIPSHVKIVLQTFNKEIIYPLYTCPGRKMSNYRKRSYRGIFKIASPENKIVVLFYYLKDKDGYAPIAAIQETNFRTISQQRSHTQKPLHISSNSAQKIQIKNEKEAEAFWIQCVGGCNSEILRVIPDILKDYELEELQKICAQFIGIIHNKKPHYTLIENIENYSHGDFQPEEKKIVYQYADTFINTDHILYPCAGWENQDFSYNFKIASATDKVVVLFQYKEEKFGYAPIAAIELRRTFPFRKTIAEIVNKFKNIIDTAIINYEQSFDI